VHFSHTLRCPSTESQPLSTSPSHSPLLEARITVSTQMRSGYTNPLVRPAASIISVHMDSPFQQAVDRSGRRLMSAEHTNKRPAPAMPGHAEPPREHKRDEKRFLLMYFGRSTLFPQQMPLEAMRLTQSGEMESKTCLRGKCFLHTDWSSDVWMLAWTKSLATCCGRL